MKKLRNILLLCTVLTCSIIAYARFIEPNRLVVKSYVVDTDMPIKPCKVVFFTDTHFGELYKEENVEKIVEKINTLEADVVIFGGDLFDNYARDVDQLTLTYLQEQFKKIDAKVGKYAVWGNHDYGGGASRIYEDFMSNGDFQILRDESQILDGFGIQLYGYDDYLMKGAQTTSQQAQSDLFNILISHEPIYANSVNNDTDNFMFSGHTHGGQVHIPFLIEDLIPEGSGDFVSGFYEKEDLDTEASLLLYVSSGIGVTRYPFRFLNAPEIIQIDFKVKE